MINYGKGPRPVSKAIRAANVFSPLSRGQREGPEAHSRHHVYLRNILCTTRKHSIHLVRRHSDREHVWISGNPLSLLPLLEIVCGISNFA